MRIVATLVMGALCLEAERVAPPRVRFTGGLTREGVGLNAAKDVVEKGMLVLRDEGENLMVELCGGLVSFPLLRRTEPIANSEEKALQATKEVILVSTTRARNLNAGVPVSLVDCRNCGLQPDLFPIVTSRQNPKKGFPLPTRRNWSATYQVCWNCGEGSWQRDFASNVIASIPCPRCALEPEFPHHDSYRQRKCDHWSSIPRTGPGDWACACCGHPEPNSAILAGVAANANSRCSRCNGAMSKDLCKGHEGPVIGNIFQCCQQPATGPHVTECSKEGQAHSHI